MQKFIKSSFEFIEQNLKADITAEELADMANYSVGHFCRRFAQTMDSTVSSYILIDWIKSQCFFGDTSIFIKT